MKKRLLFCAAFAALMVGTTTYASANFEGDNVSPSGEIVRRSGAISGRVVDVNDEPLPGAVIIVEDLGMTCVTDAYGYYYLPGIAAGDHKLKVTYIGFHDIVEDIEIVGGKNLDKIYTVSEGIEVEGIEVVGIVSGRRKALQQQKANDGVSNVISAEQMSKFPDQNIGDAMKRIPGINVQYDQGEARFGQIRGTSPDMSSVTLNGNRTPSAEGETRAAQLDLIPAEMIQTVEVNKVVTADMDGDAIGGSVNLVTKGAPSTAILNGQLGTGYNPISGKMNFNGAITAGQRFFDDKLGAIVAVSYDNNPMGSDNVEAEWSQDDDDNAYISEFQQRQYYLIRERQSYSLALDYDINENHRLAFKGLFNIRNDWENRYRVTYKKISAPDENGIATSYVRHQTKGGGEDVRYARLEKQMTQGYNLGGEHKFGILSMDWNVDYATASEVRPDERYICWQTDKKNPLSFEVNTENGRQPQLTPVDPSKMIFNAANYDDLDELTQSYEDIREEEVKGNLNFVIDLAKGDYANKLKFGYKIQDKAKRNTVTFYDVDPLESDFLDQSMAHTIDVSKDNYMAGDYRLGEFVTKEFLGDLDFNSSNFSKEENLSEEAGNYVGRETINAGYLRFDQQIGSKLLAIIGVRYENTHIDYSGNTFNLDENKNASLTPTHIERSMDNILPSLLLKYTPSENLIVRGSYTQTLARPKFSQLVPGDKIDRDENEFTQGNPDLKNTLSHNLDAMVEYYLPNAGIISAGVYYKEINDFIAEVKLKDHDVAGSTWDKYYKAVNAGNANLLGFEVAAQSDLAFISPALKNFGVYANYTLNFSNVTELTDPLLAGRDASELQLPGTPKHIANASLYFENRLFSAAVSYNYASAFLDNESIGVDAFDDRWYGAVNYLDVNASVKATKWLTVYAEVNNILNQPLYYFQGTENHVMQSEYYGTTAKLGVKLRF